MSQSDGGALLHRIPWQRGSTYDTICQKYTDYVMHHYVNPVVVFDGYSNGPSIKDNWRASEASETLSGITQLKIGDICLYICDREKSRHLLKTLKILIIIEN